jgi:xanthine dehydrogenase molybdenum-binding subunit
MAAFLTLKLDGRPVKIHLTREEGMIGTRIRHPFRIDIQAEVSTSGTLTALNLNAQATTGAYASHGHAVAGAAGAKPRFLYPRAATRYQAQTVYTTIPAAGAMRAYGSPQILFALDCIIEEAARKIGMDSLAFRQKNVVREGDTDPLTGKKIESCGLIACLQKGKQLIGWDKKRAARPAGQTGPLRRGLGVACFSYASGTYPAGMEVAGARIILNQDGSVHLQAGATEIGQGADTVLAQMVAQTLSIPFEQVHLVSTQNTDVTPFDTGAYASRQTYVASNAVLRAALQLKEKIVAYAVHMTGITADRLTIARGNIVHVCDNRRRLMSIKTVARHAYYDKVSGGQLTAHVSHKTTANAPSFGCTFVEVEVDIPLCQVAVCEIYNIHDSGVIINPVLAKGQVQGGAAMGIGAALYEELIVDSVSGRILNNNLLDYKVPTMLDIPDIGCEFVETVEPTSGYGNKALGEPPIITPPPAIRNAIWDATGVKIDELPMTPHILFKQFKRAGLI